MRLEFREQAFEDLQYWVQMNPKVAKRLLRLKKPNGIRSEVQENQSP